MTPPPTAEDDLAAAGAWLEANSALVERWLRDNASNELRQRIQQATSTNSSATVSSSRRTSITSDLFQLWLSASPIKPSGEPSQNVRPSRRDLDTLDESELFMELIRDVANELDIDVLCHKILVNVSLLTHADRGSLFLARGPPESRYLVAKLFDVRQDTKFEEAVKQTRTEDICIPFGVGIAGAVAQSKQLINIKDAYQVSSRRSLNKYLQTHRRIVRDLCYMCNHCINCTLWDTCASAHSLLDFAFVRHMLAMNTGTYTVLCHFEHTFIHLNDVISYLHIRTPIDISSDGTHFIFKISTAFKCCFGNSVQGSAIQQRNRHEDRLQD